MMGRSGWDLSMGTACPKAPGAVPGTGAGDLGCWQPRAGDPVGTQGSKPQRGCKLSPNCALGWPPAPCKDGTGGTWSPQL